MDLPRLIAFYQTLSPETVASFPEYYSANACFKDPFNDVRGVDAVQYIFRHMFTQVEAPRFVVTGHMSDGQSATLLWEFHFNLRPWGRRTAQTITGMSHLKFDTDGKVSYHRDYWDAAEELYMKLPLLGALFRLMRRCFAARPSA